MLVLASVLNIFSGHLMAMMNNVSVWWHVVGASVVILILIFIPDHHQSFSYVFTERFNNSGYSDGSTSSVMYWFLVLPFGLLLTQYTITGFDASAHLSEETSAASQAAAKGIWQSIFYSAIGGWILLLCFLFAVPNNDHGTPDNAGVGGGGVAYIFTHAMSTPWAGSDPADLRRGPVLLHHLVHDQCLADDLRLQPRRRHPGVDGCGRRLTGARCRPTR